MRKRTPCEFTPWREALVNYALYSLERIFVNPISDASNTVEMVTGWNSRVGAARDGVWVRGPGGFDFDFVAAVGDRD
jgi:hypothetical protein